MSIKRMVNCELCGCEAMRNHVVYGTDEEMNFSRGRVNLGILGELDVDTSISMTADKYNIVTKAILKGNTYPEMIHNITIQYCPFCGRELDD